MLLAQHTLNGINGALAGFWLTALAAATWESLLSTFDVRHAMVYHDVPWHTPHDTPRESLRLTFDVRHTMMHHGTP